MTGHASGDFNDDREDRILTARRSSFAPDG
jgi:hypothetical protein